MPVGLKIPPGPGLSGRVLVVVKISVDLGQSLSQQENNTAPSPKRPLAIWSPINLSTCRVVQSRGFTVPLLIASSPCLSLLPLCHVGARGEYLCLKVRALEGFSGHTQPFLLKGLGTKAGQPFTWLCDIFGYAVSFYKSSCIGALVLSECTNLEGPENSRE